jgi:FMN phosphatase YigB (HAD superfamily)
VIFDVYHTLLHVGPPPADAVRRWEIVWRDSLAKVPLVTLEELTTRCTSIIQHEHGAARAIGISYPEVLWAQVMVEAVPELSRLDRSALDELLYQHAQLQRTVSLMDGAADVLEALSRQQAVMGIASNSQAYTLRELDAALRTEKLDRSLFVPELCFWSFSFGFSKPDPHVYRFLDTRLRALGVRSGETLMVGDRADNDIQIAQAQGWQTWQLLSAPAPGAEHSGNWAQLERHLGL